MRIQEEGRQSEPNEIPEHDQAENCLDTKPNSCDENKRFFEFQCTIEAEGVTDDSKHKGSHQESETLEPGSIHWWC